jgi:hypothetical protein
MLLLKSSPIGRATMTTRATTLTEALQGLPLYMQPFPGEDAEYQLIDAEPNPYRVLPAHVLALYASTRFVTLHASAQEPCQFLQFANEFDDLLQNHIPPSAT